MESTALFNSKRRAVLLRAVLRLWYLIGSIFLAAGVLNRMYILPKFMMLVMARKELFGLTLDLVYRMNSRLAAIIAESPAAPLRASADPTAISSSISANDPDVVLQSVSDGAFVDKQTQTDDSLLDPSLLSPPAAAAAAAVSPSSTEARLSSAIELDQQTNTDSTSNMLPLSYHSLQYLCRNAKLIPSLLSNPALVGASYSVNELNLLVEELSFTSVTATSSHVRPEATSLQQTKQYVTHLRDEIRGLKSLALTMN
ncbi:hypothetical protein BZA70DRAFT_283884 [Myxozyma melibiosi]|uniref:Peroxin-14 n=1 Tax=Myxozyma melibiosi TaxID=54550 RepID=A0ABR1EZS3_9ASCO